MWRISQTTSVCLCTNDPTRHLYGVCITCQVTEKGRPMSTESTQELADDQGLFYTSDKRLRESYPDQHYPLKPALTTEQSQDKETNVFLSDKENSSKGEDNAVISLPPQAVIKDIIEMGKLIDNEEIKIYNPVAERSDSAALDA